ncbi:L-threonylcarbamoyladenylate synthase [Streptomyces sp. NPDC004327]|uniref:L-threonylcarbamoyladenylate synthase n=1 Tax=Streptomyces sp. NPDC004327 TaxID=3364699 RepID=UPI0036826079
MTTLREDAELVLGDDDAVRRAARELGEGRAVVHGFANFYALTARTDREAVARVNRLKGRPDGRPGSVTTVPDGIPGLFDWTRLPAELPRRQVRSLLEELYELGPFGFRGPAADRIPGHLSAELDGVRTVRVVAPGRHCPSNAFLAAAQERTGTGFLFVTSANRSGEPPHWRGEGAVRDFGREPGVRVLAHADDGAARLRHPYHAPVATSVVSFHRAAGYGRAGLPALTLERVGSLSAEHIRSVAANHGFALVPAAGAIGAPPQARTYVPSAASAPPAER